MDQHVEQELRKQLDQLSTEKQRRVVEFARRLASEEETVREGGDLLRFAGSIPPDDLAAMAKVIEDGCEQTNPDESGLRLEVW
jgi:hypothetical protein